jgi:hypothetical protein
MYKPIDLDKPTGETLEQEIERLRRHVWDTLESNSPADLYSTVRVAGYSDAAVEAVMERMRKGNWFIEDAREFPTPHFVVAIIGTDAGGYGALIKHRKNG